MAACEASPDNNDTEGVFEASEEEKTSVNEIKGLLVGVQQTLLEYAPRTNEWRLNSRSSTEVFIQ